MLLMAGLPLLGAWAQPYWVRDAGGAGNEHVADVRTDADGSIYVTGEFSGAMQFGGNTYVSSGAIDLFVAKLNAAGDVAWLRQGGGPGIDRGLKVAVGSGGSIAVAGEFMGSATIFGTPLTSAGGTADMFVAVLNKADGALQWIRQGGGGTGTDQPGGVSMAADGRVTVAGEFRGSATWEGSTLTSMNDGAGQPSVDVFVADYSATGDLRWLKQGAASATDRAVDVVHDAEGHAYITGQFSHAITFGQTYANTLVNASFLLRLDADGNELWFRRFGGGVFNQVHDLQLAPDGRLLVAGDLQGTMVFSGPVSVNVAASQPFAYYILSVNTDGSLQAHATYGSTSGVTVRGITADAGLVSVIGAFNCRFTDLGAHYGAQGLFMATGDPDLFIARHALSDLGLQEAQQFGGASAKAAGAIASLPGGELVFCGSFQRNLIFPAQPGFQADMGAPGSITGNMAGIYCDDPDYGFFAGSISGGLTDGFVARGYVNGRAPYDWWNRPGSGCEREPREPCIRLSGEQACADTVRACGAASLDIRLDFSFDHTPDAHFLGPPVSFQWSTGSSSASVIVTSSGTYGVTITSLSGCWQWTDSIVVVIDPLPPLPLIHDDVVINAGVPAPTPIQLCHPQTQWAWATGLQPGDSSWWEPPLGSAPEMGDSVQLDTAGVYLFHMVSEAGCTRTVPLMVSDVPSAAMPDIGAQMALLFPQDTDLDDTLALCAGSWAAYAFVPGWTIDGQPVSGLPEGLSIFWGFAPGIPSIEIDDGPQASTFAASTSGWHVLELIVLVTNAPCQADSLLFTVTDSIYIEPHPPVPIAVGLTGPNVLCDGDTILLTATCTDCDAVNWSGPFFSPVDPWTIAVSGPGQYSVSAHTTDVHGCTYTANASMQVTMLAGPVLTVDPADGILCPGTTATIQTSSQGTNATWYGPDGPIFGMGTTLSTSVPGTYFLTLDVGGCPVVSNSVQLFAFGTPYIALEPVPVLCFPGDEAVLQVMAAPGAQVQWHAPLSGSAFTRSVTEPGTYTCTVTACGISTPLSVEVAYAPAQADLLTPGPFTLCPEDSLLLQATGGAAAYVWLPGSVPGPALTVSTAGTYRVAVTNAEGCTDTSAVVSVELYVFGQPLIAVGDTVCAGDAATLTATGSGLIGWYASAASSMPLGSGSPFLYTPAASTTIHVRQTEAGCTSPSDSVQVEVKPRPPAVLLAGADSLCLGDAFTLTADGADSLVFHWTTPGGAQLGPGLSIAEVGLGDMGLYVCTPVLDGCHGPPAGHLLTVHAPEPLGLPEEASFCEGGALTLHVPVGFSEVLWSTGWTAPAITLTGPAELAVQAVDVHGCLATAQVIVTTSPCDLVVPNVFSPNADGTNDQWFPLGGFVKADAHIWNRWGGLVYAGDLVSTPWSGRHYRSGERCSDGTYFYELELLRNDGVRKRMAGSLLLTGAGR